MKLKVIEPFKFAHGGVRVVAYQKGDVIDTSEHGCDPELEPIAVREGWAKPAKQAKDDGAGDGDKQSATQ